MVKIFIFFYLLTKDSVTQTLNLGTGAKLWLPLHEYTFDVIHLFLTCQSLIWHKFRQVKKNKLYGL